MFGFSDWRTIWNNSSNADLRNKRKSPSILYPGDRVFIPDRETREDPKSTDARHSFTRKGTPLKLVLVLENLYAKPRANLGCELIVDSRTFPKVTDGKGKLEQDLAPKAEEAYLTAEIPESAPGSLIVPLRIGHLDPVEERSGQAARLNNLGYFAGPQEGASEEENERRFRSAVEEFQCDQGLKVDGVCGTNTQAKLKAVYGC
jgi:N-acetylmuramoyl-L-alanine amidase